MILLYMLERLYQEYKIQDYVTHEQRDRFHNIYDAYHALGGNGYGTALWETVQELEIRNDADGVSPFVKMLKQMGIKMAIVSNKYQQGVLDICMPLLGEYIDVMVGEQSGLNKKPSADMVDYAIQKLNADKSFTAYVGDSDIDYLTSKNAKLDFIGAAWGFRGRHFLEELKSTYVLDKFEDLLKIIQ